MQRIVFLLTVGIDRPSGRRYFQLARQLVRRGYRVRLLALHPDLATCPRRRFVADGVEVWYVGQMHAQKAGSIPRQFGTLRLLWVVVLATLGMLWGILRSPAEIYHLGKPQPINGLAALIGVCLLRRQGFYLDCDDDEVYSNRLRNHWHWAAFSCAQAVLPRLAKGITVNTYTLRDKLRPQTAGPVRYVSNGVDLASCVAPSPRVCAGLQAALGLEGRRVIVYVGTLALHNHPVDLLLYAFARLAADMPDVALLLVGGGEDLPALQQQAAALGLGERVRFTGHLPHASTRGLLALASLSVDPVCDNEVARARSPLKIFESMALHVPVVTGKVGDRSAILAYGQAGVLVEPDDAAALAAGMRMLLLDERHRQAIGRAAALHVQNYSWERLAAQWVRVYNQTQQPDTRQP